MELTFATMKKNYFFRCLICSAILLSCFSCKDDEESIDPNNVNDPEKLTESCPTTDDLEVTNNQALYYLSSWSEGIHTLSDNMVNRYREVVPYTADVLDRMKTGDAFLFSSNDIVRIQSDAELLAAMRSMVDEKGVIMMMDGGTNEEFHTVCTLLDVYNPYGETSEEADALSEASPLWVFTGELPGAKGFFAKLANTHDSLFGADGEETVETEIDEHGQGVKCDMACRSLQNALEQRPLQSGSANLTDLVNAYVVTYQSESTFTQIGTDKPRNGTNHFQLEAKIWNVYSVSQQREYYLVNLGFICNSQHSFFGEWHDNRPPFWSTPYKLYGYCLTNVKLDFVPWYSEAKTVLHEYSPTTTQSQSTYTSDVSMQLGGEISVQGPTISGGVTISNSHTETINDVEVLDQCDPIANKPRMAWSFNLKEPDAEFSMTSWASCKIKEGAKVGITTFSLSTDFIFSMAGETPDANRLCLMHLYPVYTTFAFSDVMGDYKKNREEDSPYLGKQLILPRVKLDE